MAWSALFRLVASGAGGGAAGAGGAAAAGGNVTSVLQKAGGAMKNFGSTVQGETFKALSAFEAMKMVLGSVVSGFQNATAQAKQFTNLSMRFGMPASQIASLANFANDAGISISTLAKGMQQIQTFGNKIDTAKKFKEIRGMIGASAEDIEKFRKGGVEGMALLSVKLKGVADEGEKMQILQGIFGRGAMQMRQLVEMDPEEMRRSMKNAYAVDEDAIKDANKLEKLQSDVGNYAKATGAQLLAALAPVIENVMKGVTPIVWVLEKIISAARLLSLEFKKIGLYIQRAFQFGEARLETERKIRAAEAEQERVKAASKKSNEQAAKLMGFEDDSVKAAEKVAEYYTISRMQAEDIARAAEEAAVAAEKESKWRMYTAKELKEANERAERLERAKLEEDREEILRQKREEVQKALGTGYYEETTEERIFNAENATAIAMGRVERKGKRVYGTQEQKLIEEQKGASQSAAVARGDVEKLEALLAQAQASGSKLVYAPGQGGLMSTTTIQKKIDEAKAHSAVAEKNLEEKKADLAKLEKERAEKERLFSQQKIVELKPGVQRPDNWDSMTPAEKAEWEKENTTTRSETKQEALDRLAKGGVAGVSSKAYEMQLRGVKLDEQERQNRLSEEKKKLSATLGRYDTRGAEDRFFGVFEQYMNEKTNPLANLDVAVQQAAIKENRSSIELLAKENTADMDPAEVEAARKQNIEDKANVAKALLDRRDKTLSFYQTTGDSMQAVGGGGATSLSANSLFQRQADDVHEIKALLEAAIAYQGDQEGGNYSFGRKDLMGRVNLSDPEKGEYLPTQGVTTFFDDRLGPPMTGK